MFSLSLYFLIHSWSFKHLIRSNYAASALIFQSRSRKLNASSWFHSGGHTPKSTFPRNSQNTITWLIWSRLDGSILSQTIFLTCRHWMSQCILVSFMKISNGMANCPQSWHVLSRLARVPWLHTNWRPLDSSGDATTKMADSIPRDT